MSVTARPFVPNFCPLMRLFLSCCLFGSIVSASSLAAQDRTSPRDALRVEPVVHAEEAHPLVPQTRRDVTTVGMSDDEQEPASAKESSQQRYREGRVIRDRTATFKVTGDRVEFVPSDGHDPLTVLENLALERVKNEIVRVGAAIRWDVTAMVTEYEGGNFVLLQRATIASQATLGR